MKKSTTTASYCIIKQCRMPMLFHEYLDFSDPVLKFDRLISEIGLKEFISGDKGGIGCTRYNAVDLLKTVLFGFMDGGYCSLRELEDRVQFGIADEYITVVDINHYRSDMDCFIPLMQKFRQIHGFYPKYPVADAGYGSYNNYIFCEQNGMEKFMKFPMFDKQTHDEKYATDPFRAVNFKTDKDGNLICPNSRRMLFAYKKHVRGNKYGREEEIYECESCDGCPHADKCKKGNGNRKISLNRELSTFHAEVIDNLESIHGALLRMNRSIQAEGTFGVIKYDRWYKRIVRRGIKSVQLEIFLVSIGYNLYKYYNKQLRKQKTA